jgi:hypothetical protein
VENVQLVNEEGNGRLALATGRLRIYFVKVLLAYSRIQGKSLVLTVLKFRILLPHCYPN